MGNEGRIARLMEAITGVGPQGLRAFEQRLGRMEERKRTLSYNYSEHADAALKLESMELPAEAMDEISRLLRTGIAITKDSSDIAWESALSRQGIGNKSIVKITDLKSKIETEVMIETQGASEQTE